MKNSTSLKLGIATLVAIALGFGSCKKDNTDSDTASVQDNAVVDAAFNDVGSIADEGFTGSVSSYRTEGEAPVMLSTCANVTLDTLAIPHKFTIDFGTANCLCNDANYRRGKIIVTYTGMYRDSGSSHTITFDNYFVNDNQLTGSKNVVNTGRNTSGNLTYSVSINGSVVFAAANGGGTSTYISSRTREWIHGENTPFIWSDDVYLISGTGSGTGRNGGSYTMSTTTPLRKEIGFRYMTSGILNFTPSGKATRTIDFSYLNGARDALAQVTINGTSFNVHL
jgi:hypothetical protein